MEKKFEVKRGETNLTFKRYWRAFPEIESYLTKHLKPSDKILEIGPGHSPFKEATHFIGFDEGESKHYPNFTKCDISEEKIPFEDKYFDFVYCRHVLEDIASPTHALREIMRTCKKGYIETPSPLAEIWDFAESPYGEYKGYCHHRYFIWNNGQLNVMAKYPMVDQLMFNKQSAKALLDDPYNWISPFFFENTFKFKLHQHGFNKEFILNHAKTYADCINTAVADGVKQSKHFKGVINA